MASAGHASGSPIVSAEYGSGGHSEIVDEGSFYRIDGTHIIDKFRIKEINSIDDRVEIVMKDKTVTLEVQQ